MSARFIAALFLSGTAVLAAGCAPKPQPVTITPIYDKYGEPSCPVGTALVAATASSAEYCQQL